MKKYTSYFVIATLIIIALGAQTCPKTFSIDEPCLHDDNGSFSCINSNYESRLVLYKQKTPEQTKKVIAKVFVEGKYFANKHPNNYLSRNHISGFNKSFYANLRSVSLLI